MFKKHKGFTLMMPSARADLFFYCLVDAHTHSFGICNTEERNGLMVALQTLNHLPPRFLTRGSEELQTAFLFLFAKDNHLRKLTNQVSIKIF